jgi:hypothetical protein
MLAGITADELTVKRKYKAPTNSMQRERSTSDGTRRANKWWFVVRAEESILKRLEESWDTLALPRRWRLEPLLRFADDDSSQESHGQSHSSQGSRLGAGACENGANGATTVTTVQRTPSESLNSPESPIPNPAPSIGANSEVTANPSVNSPIDSHSQPFLEID